MGYPRLLALRPHPNLQFLLQTLPRHLNDFPRRRHQNLLKFRLAKSNLDLKNHGFFNWIFIEFRFDKLWWNNAFADRYSSCKLARRWGEDGFAGLKW